MPRASNSSLAIRIFAEGEARPAVGGTAGRATRDRLAPSDRCVGGNNTPGRGRDEIPNLGMSSAALHLSDDFGRVFGRNARKQLAREAGISTDTAKAWLAGRWPQSRAAWIAGLLLAAIEKQEAALAEIKQRALTLAGIK